MDTMPLLLLIFNSTSYCPQSISRAMLISIAEFSVMILALRPENAIKNL
jgi:hypothetical protein